MNRENNCDFDLYDSDRSGHSVEFANDALKSLVETDPKLSLQKTASTFQVTRILKK